MHGPVKIFSSSENNYVLNCVAVLLVVDTFLFISRLHGGFSLATG